METWSKEETLGFLHCYHARKDEFLDSRKKTFAYANVLEDMIARGLTSSTTTTTVLEGKMITLLAAYKAAKDNAIRTGESPCMIPYMDELDEIFGDTPIPHTLDSGGEPTPDKTPESNVADESTDKEQLTVPSPPTIERSSPVPSASTSSNVRKRKSSRDISSSKRSSN